MKIEGIAPPPKEWSWSFSRLKNYETCPLRHLEVDIKKSFADDGVGLAEGSATHDALAKACSGQAPLPSRYAHLQTWVDRIVAGTGELMVEQKYALTRDFQPTTYFARNVWYRGIGDVVRIDGPVGLVADWKTGKIVDDSVQLMLMAACLFAHYPQLKRVRSEYIWLKEDCTTPEVFTRQEIADAWITLLPRVKSLETASQTQQYAPKPGGLCKKHCPVTSCIYHGKGLR